MDGNWREVTIDWQGESGFMAHNARGGQAQVGTIGDTPGIGPMEMVLAALAGCTGGDVASILQKKRQPLQDLKLRVRGRRVETYPMIYDRIEVEYLLWGDGLDPKAVEQAIQLSEEKYCSVSAMLRPTVEIVLSYKILAVGEPLPVN